MLDIVERGTPCMDELRWAAGVIRASGSSCEERVQPSRERLEPCLRQPRNPSPRPNIALVEKLPARRRDRLARRDVDRRSQPGVWGQRDGHLLLLPRGGDRRCRICPISAPAGFLPEVLC